MAGLQPRTGPSPAGADGPSGSIVTGDSKPAAITQYFSSIKPSEGSTSAAPKEEASTIRRRRGQRGKQRVIEDEPSGEVPMPRSCVVRNLSKVQSSARDCPPPDIRTSAKAVGLCDKQGDARRWDPPSSLLSSSQAGREVRCEGLPGLRPGGRYVEGPVSAPEHPSEPKPRTHPELRGQGRQVHHEYPYIGIGEDDGYGEVPPMPGVHWDDPEEEECTRLVSFIEGHVPLTCFGLYDF